MSTVCTFALLPATLWLCTLLAFTCSAASTDVLGKLDSSALCPATGSGTARPVPMQAVRVCGCMPRDLHLLCSHRGVLRIL